MPNPIDFTSQSPRFCLPLLFPGQSSKEFYVNEALVRIDALLHPAVEGEAAEPPASPPEGACWLVAESPGGAWDGHAGELACYSSGSWLFAAPREGMRVFDRSAGQIRLYRNGWQAAARPAIPAEGSLVDTEARAAILELIAALAKAGIIPPA